MKQKFPLTCQFKTSLLFTCLLKKKRNTNWHHCTYYRPGKYFYLVQTGKVVFRFDQKWLVDPWMIHIVSCSSQQSKHDVRWGEEAGKLNHILITTRKQTVNTSPGLIPPFWQTNKPADYMELLSFVHRHQKQNKLINWEQPFRGDYWTNIYKESDYVNVTTICISHLFVVYSNIWIVIQVFERF